MLLATTFAFLIFSFSFYLLLFQFHVQQKHELIALNQAIIRRRLHVVKSMEDHLSYSYHSQDIQKSSGFNWIA